MGPAGRWWVREAEGDLISHAWGRRAAHSHRCQPCGWCAARREWAEPPAGGFGPKLKPKGLSPAQAVMPWPAQQRRGMRRVPGLVQG